MSNTLNAPVHGSETEEFLAFIRLHNHRVMKKILAIYLVLDSIYYVFLGSNPGGFRDPSLQWVIPAVLLTGSLILARLILSPDSSTPLQEYVFLAYILGSRVLFGSMVGFQFANLSVYVGLMMLMSALFYFRQRLLHILLLTQTILYLQALAGFLGPYSAMILLVTTVFAAASIALEWERHRLRLQTYLLTHSVLEKNAELHQAHQEISKLYDASTEQLGRTARAETLMRGILDSSEAALILIDSNRVPKYSNDGLTGIAGYHIEDMNPDTLNRILGAEQFQQLVQTMDHTQQTKSPSILHPVRFLHQNGNPCFARIRMDFIDIAGDGHILINVTDITEDVTREQQLQQTSRVKDVVLSINHRLYEDVDLIHFLDYALSRVREVIPHADLGCIMLMDEDGTLRIVSSFGYNLEDIPSFRLPLTESFAYRVTVGNFERTIVINDIPTLLNQDCVDILPNENGYDVQSSLSGPIIVNDRLYGLINIDSKDNRVYSANDVAIMEYLREQLGLAISRRDLYQKFSYLSKHDQMTGFLNRWYLREVETEQLPRWERYGVDIAVATMDLNHMKQVNDRLGHHEGDAYIRLFSKAMQQSFRSTDLMIRLGGDEFAGVFFQVTEAELAAKLDAINHQIENSILQQVIPWIRLGFSYGIVKPSEPLTSLEELLKEADRRMYLHKTAMKEAYKASLFNNTEESGQAPEPAES